VGLRPLAYWDCGFEFRLGYGCLSLVSVVCCQVEVCATSWSLVQRSPTECGVSQMCVIVKSRKMRRPRPPRGCRAIGKKKLTLEQAVKAQREVNKGGWLTLRPGRFTPGKETRYPLYRRLDCPPGPVWIGAVNIAPTVIQSPDRPARSVSLLPLP
jgi:hypothetical protein